MKINFSEVESKVFDLRIGRLDLQGALDADCFVEQVKDLKLDAVRLKVPIEYETINLDLHQCAYPFYFSGAIKRYEVDCFKAPDVALDDGVSFHLFEGSKKDLQAFYDILKDTWGKYPLGYYKTPGLNQWITKEMELEALFAYYSKRNNHKAHSDAYLWFLQYHGELAGFIALYTYPGESFETSYIDSTIAGIKTDFQNKRLFPNILRHIRTFCRTNNLRYFRCGARMENFYSQKAFEKDYMCGIGVDLVFHVLTSNRIK